VVVPPKSKPRSSLAPPNGGLRAGASSGKFSSSPGLSPNPRNGRPKSSSPYPSSSDEKRKRKAISRTPRDSPLFGTDADDSDEDVGALFNNKRQKSASDITDPNRDLRDKGAFGDNIRETRIIHAADLSSVKTGGAPILGAQENEVAIELQYPSHCRRER
jgi:H3 lysine-79-specific histone-lysine N-methyltransferase